MTNIILNANSEKTKKVDNATYEQGCVCIGCGGKVEYLYNKYCREFMVSDLKLTKYGKVQANENVCNIQGCYNYRVPYSVRVNGFVFALCATHAGRIKPSHKWEGYKTEWFVYGSAIFEDNKRALKNLGI